MTRFQEFIMKFVVGAIALMLFSLILGLGISFIITVVKLVTTVLVFMMIYGLICKLKSRK